MHVGSQNQTKTDADLEVHAQLGVEHVCSNPPGSFRDWDVDFLSQDRQKVESYGISLNMFELPVRLSRDAGCYQGRFRRPMERLRPRQPGSGRGDRSDL